MTHDPTPQTAPRQAYATDCRWCATRVLMAITRAGRWRAFDPEPVAPEPGLHRFARGIGMVEADGVPGFRVHFCTERHTVGALAGELPLPPS